MVSRLLLPALGPALILALAGPGFDGCQGGSSGGPIPPGTMASCFTDTDCIPAGCEELRCIASQCVTVAPIRDHDLDHHAPPPCGDDCDDSDSSVFPGQAEVCDGRDQDCDMIIDEDAAPGAIPTILGTASTSLSAAAIGDAMMITDTGFGTGVRLRKIDFQGHVGPPVSVLPEDVEVVDLATTTGGGVALVARATTTDEIVESYPITLASGLLTVGAPTTLATHPISTAHITRARVEGVGASFVAGWDDATGARLVSMPAWPAAVTVAPAISASAPLDVASDGTSIVIPTSSTVVTFLAVSDGSVLGTQTFAAGLAADPLTAAASDYIVAFRDSFDHQLAHMTVASVLPSRTAPSEGSGLTLRVDETSVGPLLTRFDPSGMQSRGNGVWALVLNETLDTLRIDFPPSMVSPGVSGIPLGFDVVTSPSGTAVLTNFGMTGSVMTVLACQTH